MFGRIRSEFQYFEVEGQNSNVLTDKPRIPVFGKINQNFNVWTDKTRIPLFGRIRSETIV